MTLIEFIFFIIGVVVAFLIGPLWIHHCPNYPLLRIILFFGSALFLGITTWGIGAYTQTLIWNYKVRNKKKL
jgi:hypothetical protein